MSNYGEELAYWYLRLNGFFPITDFVFHSVRNGNQNSYNADADILAIRPPNAHEKIDDDMLECDIEIVDNNEDSKNIFVYCEVKTGDYDIPKLFPEERIKYSLRRFGLNPETPIIRPVTIIENRLSRTESGFFKKVLIANKKKNNVDEKAIFIDLNSAILFICNRFKKYDAYKYGSRMFFDSSLTQLLIHLIHNPSLIEDIKSLINNPSSV
ncbi:MAG: hypothetical protein OIN66_12580 [Candidatus Methanoperedens sp.]|nr:hypothetical protein [Candidatus Methanoperedens sp.]